MMARAANMRPKWIAKPKRTLPTCAAISESPVENTTSSARNKPASTTAILPNTTTPHTTAATLRIVMIARNGKKVIGSVPSSPFCRATAPINLRSCDTCRSFTLCFFFIVIPPDVQRLYLLSPKILFKQSFRMIPLLHTHNHPTLESTLLRVQNVVP